MESSYNLNDIKFSMRFATARGSFEFFFYSKSAIKVYYYFEFKFENILNYIILHTKVY